jgi:hypothetical protein
MKRAVITILAMLPTALLAIPGLVGAVDAVAWVVLGDTLIQADWHRSQRALLAFAMAATAVPVGMLTLSVLSDWQRRQE